MNNKNSKREVKFKVTLGYEDYKHFNEQHSKKKFLVWGIIYYILFIAVIMALSYKNDFTGTLKTVAPVSFIIVLIVLYILYSLMISKIKRAYKSNKLLREEVDYTADEDGISSKSKLGDTKLGWKEVYLVKESKKCFFVYLAKNNALIIPKRFFKRTEDLDKFKKIAADSLDKGKLRLR